MKYVNLILVAALAILLVACGSSGSPDGGSPDGDSKLIAPSDLSFSPSVAMPGDTITISANNLGSEPVIEVAGVTVTPESTTASSVVVRVPDGVWGYAAISVSNAAGSASTDGLFVGAELGTSDLTGTAIQEALDALPLGGALRLAAATYEATATLTIDNRSLYGAGVDSVVNSGSNTVNFVVMGDGSVVVQDLKIVSDNVTFNDGRLNTTANRASVQPRSESTLELVRIVEEAEPGSDGRTGRKGGGSKTVRFEITGEPAARRERTLRSEALGLTGEFSLRNVEISEANEGLGSIYGGYLTAGVELKASNLSSDNIDFDYVSGITVSGSTLTAGYIGLQVDYNGPLAVLDSQLTADGIFLEVFEAEDGLVSGSQLIAKNYVDFYEDYSGRVSVVDSVIRASDGYVRFDVSEGPLSISGSTIEARDDGDSATLGNVPFISISAAEAGVSVVQNDLIAADGNVDFHTNSWASNPYAGAAPLLVTGNTEISSGARIQIYSGDSDVTVSGNALIEAAGDFHIYTGKGDLTVTSNPSLRSGGNFDVYTNNNYSGTSNDVTFNDNIVVVDTGSDAVVPGEFSAKSGYGNLTALRNTITVTGSSGPDIQVGAAMSGASGYCEISDNTLSSTTGAAGVNGYVALECYDSDTVGTNAYTVTGNKVTSGGDTGSDVYSWFERGALSMTGNTFSASGEFYTWPDSAEAHEISGNTFRVSQGTGFTSAYEAAVVIDSDTAGAEIAFTDNTIEGNGLIVKFDEGNVSVSGNTITGVRSDGFGIAVGGNGIGSDPSVPAAVFSGNTVSGSGGGTAVSVCTDLSCANWYYAQATVLVEGNTFSGFTNALYLGDRADNLMGVAALGIDAEITGNVFDFAITAAPQAAELNNVKDSIVATGNTWGTNTDAATVESYVTLSGDTATQGGSITIAPIMQP